MRQPVVPLAAASFAAIALVTALPASAEGPDQAFSVLIENVSTHMTLRLPSGATTNVPVAPGIYAVVRGANVLFREGEPAGGAGLEPLAEDGNPGLLIESLRKAAGVRAVGMFVPGQPFEVRAAPGERLVFAAMFVQSNDLFYAPGPDGIDLFAIRGDATAQIRLWDAGTEVNQAPGVGDDQAPRQKGPNSGAAENGVVRPVSDGFAYPPVAGVLKVTISRGE
jgi:hypothetical protein